MAPQPGRKFLIKTKMDGSEDFVIIAGMRTNSFSRQQEAVDVSNKDSDTWRYLLPGAGTKTGNVSGSGVFYGTASEALIRERFGTDTHHEYEIIIPGYGTYKGKYMIESLEEAGEYNGEMTYSISLSSDGPIAFTAE